PTTGLTAVPALNDVASKPVTDQTACDISTLSLHDALPICTTTFTVTPGAASKLVITSSTADLQSGTTRTLTAEVRDASDNLVSGDRTTSRPYSNHSGTATATGLRAGTAVNGVAS